MDWMSLFGLFASPLASLIPIGGHIISRVVDSRISGGAPINADEAAELENAASNATKAIASLDDAPYESRWVNDARAIERLLLVDIIIGVWVLMTINFIPVSENTYVMMSQLASAGFFYMLGEHTVLNFRKR